MKDDEYLKLLKDELSWIMLFFKSASNLDVALPAITISHSVKDSAWYSDNTISVNPSYNDEELKPAELVAHEFFHHAQERAFISHKNERKPALFGEYLEGTAFMFAGLYLEKSTRDIDPMEYMSDRRHMTDSGVGNKIALEILRESGGDVRRFIKNALDYDFMLKTLEAWE